ncbi:hypothetical protein AMJ47_02115 [Parcubacteria bacterium DG_72]|nr:MAG: hypothetical protein AMJ47_02115 [Parcubacteria bacterium DG_72]
MNIEKEKIKEFLLKIFWSTAKHAFFACLSLFVIAFFFGVWLFNKCNIITKTESFEGIQETFLLKHKIYKDVLNNWQEDEKRYEQADYKEYINPFLREELTEEEL